MPGKFVLFQDEQDKALLGMLNRSFRAVTTEKYPKVMLSIILEESFTKIFGKNYNKNKIGQRKEKKYYAYVLNRLRSCYGKYINITNLKIKSSNTGFQFQFSTNFSRVYKTDFGLLYGSTYTGLWSTFFYTYHCFQRFDERCDPSFRIILNRKVAGHLKTEPTTADIVMFMTMANRMEFAKDHPFYYLNIGTGILVLEIYKEFIVAKTYLCSEMIKKGIQWYRAELSPEQAKRPSQFFTSFKDMMDFNPVKIENPTFWKDIVEDFKRSEDLEEEQ